MNEWSEGYVAGIDYTYGYYQELNPLRAKLALINAGIAPPEFLTACELGYGQGLSINIHAAASPLRWYGTDFNPNQAAFAQKLAIEANSKVHLSDDSFAEFVKRSDLPRFDFIGLHGIWSWVSDENRALIVQLLKEKLNVGGVLYISYNTQPGWANFIPLRYLMKQFSESLTGTGRGIATRVDEALDFVGKLIATKPGYLNANPQIAERLKKLEGKDRHYLAHEYFNRDWHPMHFSEMARSLEAAKLQFACSAHYFDHVDALNLTKEHKDLLAEIPDPVYRQDVRDFMVNQQFRRDYWVKGAIRLSVHEQAEALRSVTVILTEHRSSVGLKVVGSLGEADMSEAVYNPIIDYLGDYLPKSLGQIEHAITNRSVIFAQVVQAVMVLIGRGHVAIVQSAQEIEKVRKQVQNINSNVINRARSNGEISYLASPLTGGGVSVGRFQQLFISAIEKGKSRPEEWARFTWESISQQGQRLVKEGKTLETEEDNLAELRHQAILFEEKLLPVLRSLQVIK